MCVEPLDILSSEEIDEASVGLRVLSPLQTNRDSYTNDLLGLELQPETQAYTEATQGQGSLPNLGKNAGDLRQANARSNMTEAQARLTQLSELLPTLAPAEAIARLMALTTLFDTGTVVSPANRSPTRGRVEGQASNDASTVIKDEPSPEEASNAEFYQGGYAPNIAGRQEGILGRPPMSGNLYYSQHYPGLYVQPDGNTYNEYKIENMIIGEHNRAFGHPGSIPQEQQPTEAESSSIEKADSDGLADSFSQLQLGDEGGPSVNQFQRRSSVATTTPAQLEQPLASSSRANATRLPPQDDTQPPPYSFQAPRVDAVRPPVDSAHRATQPTSSLRTQRIHRPLGTSQLRVNGVRLQEDRATTGTGVNNPFVGNVARHRMRSTPSWPDNAITRQYTLPSRDFDMRLLDPAHIFYPSRVQALETRGLQSSQHAVPLTEAATTGHRAGSVPSPTTYDTQGIPVSDTVPRLSEPVGQSTSVPPHFRFETQNPDAPQLSLRQRRARGRVIPRYPSTRGHRLPDEDEPSMASYRRPTISTLPEWLEVDLAAQAASDAGSAVRAQYARAPPSSNQPRTANTPTPNRWDNLSTRSPASSTFTQTDAGAAARVPYSGTIPRNSNLPLTPSVPSSNRGSPFSTRAPTFIVPTTTDPGAAARAQYGGAVYGGPGPINSPRRQSDIRGHENQTPARVAFVTPVVEDEEAEEVPGLSNKDPWSQTRNRQL